MYYTYILQSLKDNRFYIGSTNDLERRLQEHNSGTTKSLRFRLPLKIIYIEQYDTLLEARRRELEIKNYKGGNEFKKLIPRK